MANKVLRGFSPNLTFNLFKEDVYFANIKFGSVKSVISVINPTKARSFAHIRGAFLHNGGVILT